jgi:signal transduction histidine kinase
MTGPTNGGAMEAERRRVFDDAQREADTMFAQYQLSQLLASGDALEDLARAVLAEIARTSRAGGAALWLAEPGRVELELVAVTGPGRLDAAAGDGSQSPPPSFADAAAAASWAVAGGWSGVQLEESRDMDGRGMERAAVGFVAVRPATGVALDSDHARYLALVRRELAITFRAAQLRSSLARDRAMLEAILEGASDAIVAVDADRRVVQLNVAAARLLGVPAREAIGAPCHEVLDCGPFAVPRGSRAPDVVDDTPPWALRCGPVCPFGNVLESGRPMTAREQTMHHRDGTQVPVSASFAPTAGPAVGAVAVIRDLRPLRALDELKSSFVAAVSHELRTPLALISGYAQSMLHLDLDPETSRRHLEHIRESVERLTELVDQILDISNLESDRLTIHLGPVSVEELLGSFAAEMADLPASPPIELSIAAGLPLVEADPLRMHQVLANLTTNTMKYAGRGASIRVRARRLDRSTVAVTVADDGAGIDPSERDQVFERFYRGRDVRESRTAGSGLGLYLCRRLIEAQGGWIRLDATTRGTSVSLGLPIASAEADVEGDGAGATSVGRVGRIIRAVRR